MADLEQLAYESSLRGLDKQERLLEEVRARTGALIAVASLTASFLGRPAVESGDPAWLVVLALAAFAGAVAAGLYVLVPKRNLIFSINGSKMYEELYAFRDEPGEVYRRLAYQLELFWDANDKKLGRLFLALRVATLALAAEIASLLVSVGDNLF